MTKESFYTLKNATKVTTTCVTPPSPSHTPKFIIQKNKKYSWIFFHKLTTYLTLAKIINLRIKILNLRNLRTEFGQPFCELEKGRKEVHNWMNEELDEWRWWWWGGFIMPWLKLIRKNLVFGDHEDHEDHEWGGDK
jgi:hypothetical protein